LATDKPTPTRGNRLLAALASEDRTFVGDHMTEVSLELGTLLHEAGSAVEHVYFPHEGMVSLLAVMADGESIETATVGSEGVVGANAGLGGGLSFTRAVVQAPLVAARISASHFRAAVGRSDRLKLLTAAYNEVLLAQVQQTAACNALHAIEARLARWLLQTRDRVDADMLPLTQEFLSQMLGVQRTTVNLAARQLQGAGTIILRRGRIIITDREGLEELSCECYAVVRDQLKAVLPT
jgi:CRP-like cAMP-binding protein